MIAPDEMREIARSGDTELMAEAFLRIAEDADAMNGTALELSVGPHLGHAGIKGRMFCLLWRRRGSMVGYELLMSTCGTDSDNILRSSFSRLKSRVRELGWPIRFVTVHGYGVRLEITDTGWEAPWEAGVSEVPVARAA